MFAVIYKFTVKEGQDENFIHSWEELTKLIRKYEGSYGSRLHRISAERYLAYALWPNRETWKNSGKKLPAESAAIRNVMRESCVEIDTEYELNVVSDLLNHNEV